MKDTNNIVSDTLELYSIKKNPSTFARTQIKSSADSFDLIRQFFGDDIGIFESFFLLCLNNSNETVGYAKISQGGITGTVVDMRIILKYAIDNLATSIIISHNHPSGTLRPSEADKTTTAKIKNALKFMDITLLDHLIITEDAYYSFADEGIL